MSLHQKKQALRNTVVVGFSLPPDLAGRIDPAVQEELMSNRSAWLARVLTLYFRDKDSARAP
jgi:metal-responsive CopG/Arc/MetJ family transcriptional regulator